MRILLMSMPDNIPLFNCYHGFVHNLALRSLAGNLDINGVDVKIVDLIFFQKGIRKIVKRALPTAHQMIRRMTGYLIFQYCLGRYGKSAHRF